ncbi:MAG: DJ-1/PfpI family protein [Polyangiaceae bacterium]
MTIRIGMLLFPNLTQLDLTGPYEVLARVPGAELSLVWKDLSPVQAGTGLTILPTVTLAEAPQFDVLFVPGGRGCVPLMHDVEVRSFLRKQAEDARYVTAVCTGSLLLGAAGLLEGYEATTHWAFHELLAQCGARPVRKRVVIDRNRITGGGVTAGIDFGLRLAAALSNEPTARAIQLGLEYDPEPPYRSGSPDVADTELVQLVRAQLDASRREHEAALSGRA